MLLNPTQARAVLAHAARERFALLAVNADSPAAVQDAVDAARAVDAPIIIETSLWQLTGRSFGAGDPLRGMARYLVQLALLAADPAYAAVPIIYHTDHIKGPETRRILQAAISGVAVPGTSGTASLRASTISLDSSALSEAENIALCRDLCQHAEAGGWDLALEMETGVDDGITPLETTTRLLGAVEALHPGHLALYAPGVGTRHGFAAGGFPDFSPPAIAAHAAAASQRCGRPIGIALHGSSGLSDQDLIAAVAHGVTKVNWSSESLRLRAQAAAAYYAAHGPQLDGLSPTFKATAMDDGVQRAVAAAYRPHLDARLRLLGGAGQGSACHRLVLGLTPDIAAAASAPTTASPPANASALVMGGPS